jgi:hypothetical protein
VNSEQTKTQLHFSGKTASAFHPYIRPPDPFLNAPFDHHPTSNLLTNETRNSSTGEVLVGARSSNASSITPTSLSNSKLNECKYGDSEVVKIIGNKTLRTPVIKSIPNKNPFVDAPFTSKKTKSNKSVLQNKPTQIPLSNSSTLISELNSLSLSTNNENESQPACSSNLKTESFTDIKNRFELATANTSANGASSSSKSTLVPPNSNRFPQSQSLNEIKSIEKQLSTDNKNQASQEGYSPLAATLTRDLYECSFYLLDLYLRNNNDI